MCTSTIIQHWFVNTSKSFNKPFHCISDELSRVMLEKIAVFGWEISSTVTFLGTQDEWIKKAGIYKHLYEMDTNIAYDWLRVWVNAKHPSFQNCTIDTSDSVRDGLKLIMEKIIKEAIMTTDPDIIGISSMLDTKDEENSEGTCNFDHEAASPYTIHTRCTTKTIPHQFKH